MTTTWPARAIVLDRDCTFAEPRNDPACMGDLVIAEGIGSELRALQRAGFRLVIIANQPGIALGDLTLADLARAHDLLLGQLWHQGVHLEGIFVCPHHPGPLIPADAAPCACRAPQPGLLLQAAADLRLDLARSWHVGTSLGDCEAGKRVGCRTILVDLGSTHAPTRPLQKPNYVARTTVHALQIVRALERSGPLTELTYRPARWH